LRKARPASLPAVMGERSSTEKGIMPLPDYALHSW
jgi:hypothetical protein